MHSWREIAARVVPTREAEPEAQPKADYGVPAEVLAGVSALRRMAPPRGAASDEAWRQIVADAVTITHRGWASQALALGWSSLDVYGCGVVGGQEFLGLAVWLAGRRVVLIDESHAIAVQGAERTLFYRRERAVADDHPLSPIHLWEIGGKRAS